MSGPDYVGHFPPADLVLSPELHATINYPAEVRTVGGTGGYYLLSTHIEFSQIFKTLQIQIEFGALKLFRNSKSHNSE